jgi:hypothetical protein
MVYIYEGNDWDHRYSWETNEEGKHYDYYLGIWIDEREIQPGYNIDVSGIQGRF